MPSARSSGAIVVLRALQESRHHRAEVSLLVALFVVHPEKRVVIKVSGRLAPFLINYEPTRSVAAELLYSIKKSPLRLRRDVRPFGDVCELRQRPWADGR